MNIDLACAAKAQLLPSLAESTSHPVTQVLLDLMSPLQCVSNQFAAV